MLNLEAVLTHAKANPTASINELAEVGGVMPPSLLETLRMGDRKPDSWQGDLRTALNHLGWAPRKGVGSGMGKEARRRTIAATMAALKAEDEEE